MSTRDLRARNMIMFLACLSVVGAFAFWLTACDMFVGPATHQGPEYLFSCDDGEKCLIGKEYCSSTKPRRCITDWQYYGISRDAGGQ